MSWNGCPVIDLDSHIVERADQFYGAYLDPAYHEAYGQLCAAITQQADAGNAYSLFGSRTSIVEPIEAGRPLGRRDTFGLTKRSNMDGGRRAFPPGRADALPPIRREVSWDAKVRLEDMDRAKVDVNVLYPTHVSSYCALRDVGFENALYRAYHRWVVDFCSQRIGTISGTCAGLALPRPPPRTPAPDPGRATRGGEGERGHCDRPRTPSHRVRLRAAAGARSRGGRRGAAASLGGAGASVRPGRG